MDKVVVIKRQDGSTPISTPDATTKLLPTDAALTVITSVVVTL